MRHDKFLKSLLVICLLTGCKATPKEEASVKPEETKEPEPTPTPEPEKKSVSFVCVGDNLLHELVYKEADQGDGTYDFVSMYGDTVDAIRAADVAFVDQETIIGGEELGLSGFPVFCSPNDTARNLKEAGFDIANMATNHALDRGLAGVQNEIEQFKKNGIIGAGLYDSQEAYDDIVTFERNGITFSFLAYTWGTNGITPENKWQIKYFDDDLIKDEITRAKEISDVVIVSAHWGTDDSHQVNDMQRHYGELMAEYGADVIIGTHTHAIQPVEWLEGKDGHKTLVMWCLGNYLHGMINNWNLLGGMCNFNVTETDEGGYAVEDVQWTPLVMHYEGVTADYLNQRWGFKIYYLKDYTEELGKKHCINTLEGMSCMPEFFEDLARKVIDPEFLNY